MARSMKSPLPDHSANKYLAKKRYTLHVCLHRKSMSLSIITLIMEKVEKWKTYKREDKLCLRATGNTKRHMLINVNCYRSRNERERCSSLLTGYTKSELTIRNQNKKRNSSKKHIVVPSHLFHYVNTSVLRYVLAKISVPRSNFI
jgi:hypothetical protein